MRRLRGRFTILRGMAAVAASAVVFTILSTFFVPVREGLALGGVSCLAILGIACHAEDARDYASGLLAVAVGILVGVPLVQDSCTPIGVYVGPIAGYLTRVITRGPRRTR